MSPFRWMGDPMQRVQIGLTGAMLLIGAAMAALVMPGRAQDADAFAPAAFTISDTVLRTAAKVPPLGANNYGGCGAVQWAANNFVANPGNEPVYWKNLHRVMACGPNWFEIDGGGVSWWDLWASGFLSGADLRIYRIVDANGAPLPVRDGYLDMGAADRVAFVGRTQVIPEGSPGFPDGGWVVTKYGDANPNGWIRGGNLSTTDAAGLENGRTYWYSVVALTADGQESDLADEVSATPTAGTDTPPHILVSSGEDRFPDVRQGEGLRFEPKLAGGQPPFTWAVVDDNGLPGALPAGLRLDPSTGAIEGVPTATAPADTPLLLQVTDARGSTDVRRWVMNPSDTPKAEKPQPPTGLAAVAGDGCVTLAWLPSPSPGVAGYRLKRSTAPIAKQENRIYVVEGAPKIEPFDYVVVERRFGSYDMKYTHPRVRGIGNPMDSPNWHWRGEPRQVRFSLVPHPKPVPEAMADPGETCLQVDALVPEETSINQLVFIGTDHGGESIWYGQLEPGKHYRLSVWLRQEGLGNGGAVRFSYGQGYPGISHDFSITNQWAEYTFEFDGPERPKDPWHFGHTFTFTGPGKLWMDNCRIARIDRPEDAAVPYVPNATVLDELMAASPASGPKGMQRCWVLARDSKMDHLLSWYGNSQVRPDWSTSVSGTVDMTMPQLLEFCRLTGPDPAQRVVPWIVIQHILHDEDDWLALVEYLAAPYDPAVDSPETKPWAYRRFQQRGVGTPWIGEFRELIIEFGNETWHNGVFEDWLGFRTRDAVWQGGQEYGMFARYLIENMQRSPYWQQAGLRGRIRFALGDGYIRRDINGRMLTYGEEAMLECPQADILAHANYVGPKWETGDASSGIFDDHGVQATLMEFQTGGAAEFGEWQKVRDEMAAAGHVYDLAAYESGPSGYSLPGQGSPDQVEVNERYGKSLAMGVAALDAWLGAYGLGWTHQGFLSYGQGQYWNSHTWFSEGFRPSPGWQALALRNRFASGDAMQVGVESTPMLKLGEASYPLVGAYAFREGDRWSVFVLSRKLDGHHDGADFGDGSTPVTLSLPFASAQRITLHRLAGDPRDNNRSEMRIAPESVDVPGAALRAGEFQVDPQTGGAAGGMPPGSIYCYVFEGVR